MNHPAPRWTMHVHIVFRKVIFWKAKLLLSNSRSYIQLLSVQIQTLLLLSDFVRFFRTFKCNESVPFGDFCSISNNLRVSYNSKCAEKFLQVFFFCFEINTSNKHSIWYNSSIAWYV